MVKEEQQDERSLQQTLTGAIILYNTICNSWRWANTNDKFCHWCSCL